MGDVKRYAIRSQLINLALFDEKADGGFVKYEDYARAEQRVEELKGEHTESWWQLLDRASRLARENAALQREIAALRAPVTTEWSDDEFSMFAKEGWSGDAPALGREEFNALMEHRASEQGEKGDGNG